MLEAKHKVGRNEPCPCESGLKFKNCHDDPGKKAICEAVVRETMLKLIRAEQRMKIIRLRQKSCLDCDGTGKQELCDPHDKELVTEAPCLTCQFVDESERNAEIYRRNTESDT